MHAKKTKRIAEIARRQLLQAGTVSLFSGLSSARSLQAAASTGRQESQESHLPSTAKNCILVYLLGGPPHLDMWDPKPQAPVEIRGPFETIDTAVSGLRFSEHLPLLAQRADQLSILRSVSYPNNDHPYMIYNTLTGRVSPTPLGANTVLPPSRSDYPHLGAVVSKFKHTNPRIPGYVAIPEVQIRMMPVPVAGGGRAGFLGPGYDPLPINEDPRKPLPLLNLPEGVTAERFNSRTDLLAILDGHAPRSSKTEAYGVSRDSALRLTGGRGAGGLFDLAAESAADRERYGRHRFGQSLLLARRLVEQGVSFVGVHFNYMSKADGWDLHTNNHASLKGELLPLLDQGLSVLLADLSERGLLDETLVVTMGEFGRSPKINKNAGRDHWGRCGSAVLAGGGIRGGNVVGASDKMGAYPATLPIGPADVVASIYHAMGLEPEQAMYDGLNRPVPLSIGNIVRELF